MDLASWLRDTSAGAAGGDGDGATPVFGSETASFGGDADEPYGGTATGE
jgi:hypothetical protein